MRTVRMEWTLVSVAVWAEVLHAPTVTGSSTSNGTCAPSCAGSAIVSIHIFM